MPMQYNVTKLLFLPFQKKHNETFSTIGKGEMFTSQHPNCAWTQGFAS